MEYTRSAVFTLGSPTLTVDTNRMAAGLFLYKSDYIPICTTVLTIDDVDELTMSDNALLDGTVNVLFSDVPPYKLQETCEARKEVQWIVNNEGSLIHIVLRDETNVTRDDYNSIKRKAQSKSFWVKAYPIIENPSKNELDETGLKEDCQVSVKTAYQDWIDAGYDLNDIILNRSTVKHNAETYKIVDRNNLTRFGNSYLYIVLGLRKE